MTRKVSTPLLLVPWLILCNYAIADENVPDWLSGKPDALEHPHHAKLYEHVISDAQQQLKVSLAGSVNIFSHFFQGGVLQADC